MTRRALEIPSDHPAFAGHFPGQPIMPGAGLLDLAQRVITHATGIKLTGLQLAKFHRPVKPGEKLMLDYQIADKSVKFEISHENHKVAEGKFLVETELPS